jgi:hypothetical protein
LGQGRFRAGGDHLALMFSEGCHYMHREAIRLRHVYRAEFSATVHERGDK